MAGCAVVASAWTAASAAGAPGAASPAGTSASPKWAAYFLPLRAGWTCRESVDANGITGTATLRVASITRVAGGRAVTVVQQRGQAADGPAAPADASLRYVLRNDGTLVSVPSASQLGGGDVRVTGSVTYPSVHALLHGTGTESSLRITTTLPAPALAALRGALTPGSRGIDATIALRQDGGSAGTVSGPMGTFRRVLVVQSTVDSIAVTNATPAAAATMAAQLQPVLAGDLDATTWYAPGVGPVKIALDGSTAVTTGCGPGPRRGRGSHPPGRG